MCPVVVVLVSVCGVAWAGAPLVLTPLLSKGQAVEAQRLALVNPDIANTTSYSGYFNVNITCGSNLFFWFFPAQKNWKQAPVMLWLQGGPGDSSMKSVFLTIGPLTYDGRVGTREYSWNVENNLLFIEQPVGTGFSFSEKGCYARNQEEVARDLYSGLVQFFQLFPELKSNKFYIAGESYAGHFIPALGHTIHKKNSTADMKINLSGMMIGNGWMDAVFQNDLGSYLYQHGLIDEEGKETYQTVNDQMVEFIRQKECKKGLERFIQYGSIYWKTMGNVSYHDYLQNRVNYSYLFEKYITLEETREAIHVGNTNYSLHNTNIFNALLEDEIFSVKPWVEELLEHYPMVFYTGQLDVICSYPGVVSFLKGLDWSGRAQFKSSPRQKWCVDGEQAGYYRGAHNLHDVMVRKAGHSVPFYQPLWSYLLANSVLSSPKANPLQALTPCP